MDNMISRQAAIDAINTWDKFGVDERGRLVSWHKGLNLYVSLKDVLKTLVNLPAAELIRCKDCKHYQFADNRAFGMPVKICEWFGFEDVDDNDFCSRAERRNDG